VVEVFGGVQHRLKTLIRDVAGPKLAASRPSRVDLPLDTYGLGVGASGHLELRSVDLGHLVAEYGSPLHVVDADRLTSAAEKALAPHLDPDEVGCDIYYSYKTNPVPGVLRRLHDVGVGAEVISEYELWLALRLGVPGERIIYNGPAKSDASLRLAIESDVRILNANSIGEIGRIATAAEATGRVAPIGLRVALAGGWGGQFGIVDEIDTVAPVVTRSLADARMRLDGLHVHRGVTIRSADDLAGHVGGILGFADRLRERTGWSPRLIDLGGSLADPHVAGFDRREFRLNRFLGSDILAPDPEQTVSIAHGSRLAATMVAEWADRVGVEPPDVVMEPGRSLTGDTQFLLATVLDVKEDTELPHAVLDAGINVAEAAAHEYHQLYHVHRPEARATRSYRLAGPICTPADVLYNNWRLPDLGAGDVLAIMDTGAYFVPFSTSFSFPRPAIVECSGTEVSVIRERETYTDLVANDRAVAST
jgi:diaminopimelate decarboxylase